MRVERRFHPQLIFLLLIVNAVSVAGEETGIPQAESEKIEWRVGFSVFQIEESDPGLVSAAALLPRLIRDELTGADIHQLTDSEKEFLAQEAIEQRLMESYDRLNGLFSSRDEIMFEINSDPAALRNIDVQIEEEQAQIVQWKDYSTRLIKVPDEFPVTYEQSPEGGDLWELEGLSASSFLRGTDLDVLITGSIVRVGEYFGIRVSAFGPTGEEILWEGAEDEDGLESVSLEAGAAARQLVLGRPWASLTVQTEPPDSVISINGSGAGVGYWSDSTLVPGAVTVEVTASGHAPEIINVALEQNEIRTMEIDLEETSKPQILVRTEPTGATVRLGSLWLGRAPIAVDLPDRVMSLSVEKKGYRTRVIPLYPDSERLTIPMEFIQIDPLEELTLSRKKLQNSIAWFSFSLAPTIILLGVSQNYANMFQAASASGNSDDQVSAFNAYNLSYGLMWGSVAINLGLLTNVIFKLIRYLNAAEDLSS